MASIFITANSNGLGLGLTRYYLARGDQISAYHTAQMPDIDSAASSIAASFERNSEFPNGSFVDVRQL